MEFGLSLCPEVGRHDVMLAQAKFAEELGYDSVWVPEHHLMAGYIPSPMMALAAVAAVTTKVRLGTDVAIVPFYPAVRLAEDTATLADFSNDRFVLGVGLGYRPEEFAAYGIPFEQRGAIMSDNLAAISALLKEENVSYSGTHVNLDNVTIYPRPTEPVPIWVGGWSKAAIRRAAQIGDAWFPGPTADFAKLRACLDMYEAELAPLGKTRTELPLFREVWVADTPELLAEGKDRLHNLYADDYVTWSHSNVQAGKDDWAGLSEDRFLIGTPDEVAEKVARYRDELGVTHLVARMHFHGSDATAVNRSMELFAEQVMPRFSGSQK